MLFNSYEFIFAFLPVTLFGFYVLGYHSREWSLAWLILASVFFYGWWRPVNLLLIAPSIIINYLLAQWLLRLGKTRPRPARLVLLLGIAFNLVFLGYFKYINFFRGTINDVFGTNLILIHLILPLGISFITFQKIGFLVYLQGGRLKSLTFRNYCLFVLFFPQLIAGPIVHYREMMPQFEQDSCRFDSRDFAVGLTLFFFGLFKKLILADSIALLVTPIYVTSATGHPVSLLLAWMAAVGFMFQIYFDFSGYSDMALGLARLFGIKLPMNFNSPLRASSIIDFWAHWHMTLTRFLTAYVYNPISLALTRRRLAQGRPGLAGHNTTLGAFVTLLMFPILLTMLISGLWHGAGYQFIVWGLLHGTLLTINHAWRLVRPKVWADTPSYTRFMRPFGFILTFTSIVATIVFFRAPTIRSAVALMKGMIGLNGITLPQAIYDRLAPMAGWVDRFGIRPDWISGHDFMMLVLWILVLSLIALGLPNTLQILARYEPALGVRPTQGATTVRLAWAPSIPWAIGMSLVAAAGILALGHLSEFLYWQF